MDLALVLLFVLIGTGAIVYAGMRPAAAKSEAEEASAETTVEDDQAEAPEGEGDGNGATG